MQNNTIQSSSKAKPEESMCDTCLFVNHDSKDRENCLRFARFVDHALHDTSRDCDYWTPAPGR